MNVGSFAKNDDVDEALACGAAEDDGDDDCTKLLQPQPRKKKDEYLGKNKTLR